MSFVRLPTLLLVFMILALITPEAAAMLIYVQDGNGTSLTIDAEPADTIDDLRAKIFDQNAWPIPLQALTFNSQLLSGNATLSNYNILPFSTVNLAYDFTVKNLVGTQSLDQGGLLAIAMKDANGARGTDWSGLHIDGDLAINATSGNPFVIKLYSSNANSAPGLTQNFNSGSSYYWTIATVTGAITGFAADKFMVDTSDFQNAGFVGTISVQNDSIVLAYSAVPEPAATALAIATACAVLVALRYRRKQPALSARH